MIPLTDVGVSLSIFLLVFLPVETVVLVGLGDLFQVAVSGSVVCGLVPRSVVFPRSDGTLDAFIVEVGVILLLESRQDLLELLDPLIVHVSFASDPYNRFPQLVDPLLRQTSQYTQLASLGADIPFDHPALFSPLDIGVFCFQLLQLMLLAFDFRGQSLQAVFNFSPQPCSLNDKLLALLRGIAQALLSDLIQTSPLLANLLALIRTLQASYLVVLLASVAAKVVIADTIVDAGEGNISRQVALVFAVEAWEGQGVVDVISY